MKDRWRGEQKLHTLNLMASYTVRIPGWDSSYINIGSPSLNSTVCTTVFYGILICVKHNVQRHAYHMWLFININQQEFVHLCQVLLESMVKVWINKMSISLTVCVCVCASVMLNALPFMIKQTHKSQLFSLSFRCLQCSFLPKFSIHIETKYEDNNGSNDNVSIELSEDRMNECVQIVWVDLKRKRRSLHLNVGFLCFCTFVSPSLCFSLSDFFLLHLKSSYVSCSCFVAEVEFLSSLLLPFKLICLVGQCCCGPAGGK